MRVVRMIAITKSLLQQALADNDSEAIFRLEGLLLILQADYIRELEMQALALKRSA